MCVYFASYLGQAMTTVAVHVDSKAELTTLLEQWEKEHGSGQDMVPILTRYDQLSGFFFLKEIWELPGGPVVINCAFIARGTGSAPSWWTEILQAVQHGQERKKKHWRIG